VLLLLWPARRRALVLVTVAALVVQLTLSAVRLDVPMGPGWFRQVMLWHGSELFPFWIGYFAAGVLAGRWLRARGGRGLPAWPFAIAVPVTAAALLWEDVSGAANAPFAQGTGAFLRPMLLPFAVAISGLVFFGGPSLLRRTPRLGRAANLLSRHSLGVYIIHPLLLTGLGRLLAAAMHQPVPISIPPFLALTAMCGGGALLASVLLARTPLAVVIGEERVPRRMEARRLEGRAGS
jgi:hypothetical protein